MTYLLRLFGRWVFWAAWPLLFAYLRFSRRSRVLVVCNDEILITKGWLGPDEWSLPGGGLRFKEQPSAAAARELFEETGLRVDPTELKPLKSARAYLHGLKFFSHYFLLTLKQRPPLKPRLLEVTDIKWLGKAEIKTARLSPEIEPLVRQYFGL